MSVTLRVIVQGKPDIRALSFEFRPRVGDFVSLPDLDGDLHYRVDKVIHTARLAPSNEVADAHFILALHGRTNAQRA